MNVRSGPGLTYDVVTTVPQNTQARIVGIDPDNEWYQVEIDGVEGQVWIYQGLTTLVGSLVGVRQFTAAGDCAAAWAAERMAQCRWRSRCRSR